jgi:hypothetical protein
LVEEGLGSYQVVGVEALGKPVADIGEHRERFISPSLLREQPHETYQSSRGDVVSKIPVLSQFVC